MAIETEVKQRRNDLRVVSDGPERIFTNPGRPRLIETDFGRLGEQLGGVTAAAFRMVGSQRPENIQRGKELRLLNPDGNAAEVLREAGVSSFYTNQVMEGWNIQTGNTTFKDLVPEAGEDMKAYGELNLDATPEDMSSHSMEWWREKAKDLDPQAQATVLGMATDAIPVLASKALDAQAKTRMIVGTDTLSDAMDTAIMSGTPMADVINKTRAMMVDENKWLSAEEWDSVLVQSFQGLMAGPDYGGLDAAELEELIIEHFANDPIRRSELLSFSMASSERNATRHRQQRTLRGQNYMDELVTRFVDFGKEADTDELGQMAKYNNINTYQRIISALKSGQAIGLETDDFNALWLDLQDDRLSWTELTSPEGRWYSLSPAQRSKLSADHRIKGWAGRNAGDKEEEAIYVAAHNGMKQGVVDALKQIHMEANRPLTLNYAGKTTPELPEIQTDITAERVLYEDVKRQTWDRAMEIIGENEGMSPRIAVETAIKEMPTWYVLERRDPPLADAGAEMPLGDPVAQLQRLSDPWYERGKEARGKLVDKLAPVGSAIIDGFWETKILPVLAMYQRQQPSTNAEAAEAWKWREDTKERVDRSSAAFNMNQQRNR